MADDTNTPEMETEGSNWLVYAITCLVGCIIGGAIIFFLIAKPNEKQAKTERFIADSTAAAKITSLESGLASAKDDLSSCEDDRSALSLNYDNLKEEADTLRPMVAILDSTLTATKAQLAQALSSSKKGKKVTTAAEPAATGTAANTLPAGVTPKPKSR